MYVFFTQAALMRSIGDMGADYVPGLVNFCSAYKMGALSQCIITTKYKLQHVQPTGPQCPLICAVYKYHDNYRLIHTHFY